MDPTECLRRFLVSAADAADLRVAQHLRDDAAANAREALADLARWTKKGGFLPVVRPGNNANRATFNV